MINTVGKISYDQDQLIHIHPRVEGWVENLYVKAEGDAVEAGAPLYTIYSPQLVNAQEEFLIALSRNNQALIAATKARLEALQLAAGFVANLKQQRQVKQHITFYARQSGVVEHLNIREGFYVKPGTTLMSIADLSQVWLETEVFARDADLIEVGLPVHMTLDYRPNQQWQGQIDYLYPTLDSNTHTLRLRSRFNNQDQQLKPDMYATVQITTTPTTKQLVVPLSAVIRTASQNRVVLALGQGQFKSIAVQLGRVSDQQVEVLTGLQQGDSIVVSAQFLLDSESSQTSDFMRFSDHAEPKLSATVTGTINHVMPDTSSVNISRGAIEKWQRGPATLDFQLADWLPLSELTVGATIHFTFEIRSTDTDKYFMITQLHPTGEHND